MNPLSKLEGSPDNAIITPGLFAFVMNSGRYLRQGAQRRNPSLGRPSEPDKGSYLPRNNEFENHLFFLFLF
jgi:hypothetical protein